MDRKAQANLRAGQALLKAGLLDPAASRLYYSVFQSAVAVLEQRDGRKAADFKSGAPYWQHDVVENNTRLLRREGKDRPFYRAMRLLRVRADYEAAPVEREAVERWLPEVEAFVGAMKGLLPK